MFRRLSLPAKATLLLSLVVFGVVLALTYFMAQSSKSVIEVDYRRRSISAADRLASKLGNLRELENTIERLCQFSRGGIITLDDLPPKMNSKVSFHHSHLFDGLPSLDELERRYPLHILEVTKHHRSQTAEILGVNRRTLYRMAERFGIDLKED